MTATKRFKVIVIDGRTYSHSQLQKCMAALAEHLFCTVQVTCYGCTNYYAEVRTLWRCIIAMDTEEFSVDEYRSAFFALCGAIEAGGETLKKLGVETIQP